MRRIVNKRIYLIINSLDNPNEEVTSYRITQTSRDDRKVVSIKVQARAKGVVVVDRVRRASRE